MDFTSGDISALLFKRIVRNDRGDFALDPKMLTVFMELDGETSLNAVAKKTGMNMSTLREVVSKLLRLKLIEKVDTEIKFVDRDFVHYLAGQLSLAVGPIADVLIEDEVRDLGYELMRFPTLRTIELVERLSREIRRSEKKATFKRNMINKIREKGYIQP